MGAKLVVIMLFEFYLLIDGLFSAGHRFVFDIIPFAILFVLLDKSFQRLPCALAGSYPDMLYYLLGVQALQLFIALHVVDKVLHNT